MVRCLSYDSKRSYGDLFFLNRRRLFSQDVKSNAVRENTCLGQSAEQKSKAKRKKKWILFTEQFKRKIKKIGARRVTFFLENDRLFQSGF